MCSLLSPYYPLQTYNYPMDVQLFPMGSDMLTDPNYFPRMSDHFLRASKYPQRKNYPARRVKLFPMRTRVHWPNKPQVSFREPTCPPKSFQRSPRGILAIPYGGLRLALNSSLKMFQLPLRSDVEISSSF